MNRTAIGLLTLTLISIGMFMWLTRGSHTADQSTTSSGQFSSVRSAIDQGAVLLDVRSAAEYRSGHIAKAVNLDVEDIRRGTMPDVAKSTTIYVYCRSGNRSAQAKQLLETAGFTDIVDLGGIKDVQRSGGELSE